MCRVRNTLFILGLILSACSQEHSDQPSPEAVLQNTAAAHQNLQSAAYEADINLTVENSQNQDTVEGNATVDGVVQNAGKQSALTMDFDLSGQAGGGSYQVNGQVELVSLGRDEVFFRINTLEVAPSDTFIDSSAAAAMQGQWWQLPSEVQPAGPADLTVDPRLLRAQTEVVRVTRDHGQTTYNGKDVYHYDVEVDPERLHAFLAETTVDTQAPSLEEIQASLDRTTMVGSFWIDTETYYIHRAEWKIVNEATAADLQAAHVNFSIIVTKHNNAEPIQPPADAQVFSPLSLLERTQGGATPPLDSPAMGQDFLDMDAEQQQRFIDSFVDGPSSSSLTP